jgi:hypothetical protein
MISGFLFEFFFSLFQPRHGWWGGGGAKISVNWNNFAIFWEQK